MAELEPICCRVCDKGMGELHHGNCVYGGENVVRAGNCVNNPPDIDLKAARAAVFMTDLASLLQFVRDGVPCEDQEGAKREFIERYGVANIPPKYEFNERLKRAALKYREKAIGEAFDAAFKAEDFTVLGVTPPEPPKHIDCSKRCIGDPELYCRAGHKLNSVGKCSCDVTPLGLNAKVVREAIRHIADERKPGWSMWHRLAYNVSDDDLLKLWRLLR